MIHDVIETWVDVDSESFRLYTWAAVQSLALSVWRGWRIISKISDCGLEGVWCFQRLQITSPTLTARLPHSFRVCASPSESIVWFAIRRAGSFPIGHVHTVRFSPSHLLLGHTPLPSLSSGDICINSRAEKVNRLKSLEADPAWSSLSSLLALTKNFLCFYLFVSTYVCFYLSTSSGPIGFFFMMHDLSSHCRHRWLSVNGISLSTADPFWTLPPPDRQKERASSSAYFHSPEFCSCLVHSGRVSGSLQPLPRTSSGSALNALAKRRTKNTRKGNTNCIKTMQKAHICDFLGLKAITEHSWHCCKILKKRKKCGRY